MADQITKDGIEISTAAEIADAIINGTETTQGLKDIFGQDTNFDQDTPDAQLVNIFAQAKRDLSELAVQIFNSFDPDQASGSVLDARVLYNGVIRKGGTYTEVELTILTNREITLKGIDRLQTDDEIREANVFTVQDYNANQYYLIDTVTLPAGTNTNIGFRAQYMGETLSTLNSINEIVTPERGVISVNNPNPPTKIGVAQETDDQLKLRRARAVGLGMLGSVEVMQASLRQLSNVTDACVFENNTNVDTEDGIPPHSVWVIVRGGNDTDIANCIYLRLNAGCGMKGDTTVTVDTIYSEPIDIKFDNAVKENLSIRMKVRAVNGVDVIDTQVLSDFISYNYKFNIYEPVTATRIDAFCKAFSNNFEYSEIQVSAMPNTRGSITADDLDPTDLTEWQAISYGCLNVTLDGADTVQINGMNFANVTSYVDIANIISEAFKAYGYEAYAEGTDTSITIYSMKRGDGSSIAVNAISGNFDDLSGSSFLDADNMTEDPGDAAYQGYIPGNVMDSTHIAALKAVTNGSFGININGAAGDFVQVSGLDFSDIETAEDVATVVNSKLNSVVIEGTNKAYCDATGLQILIYSEKYGSSSSIAIGPGTTGTNLVSSSLLIDTTAQPVQGIDGTNGTLTSEPLSISAFENVHRGVLSIKVNGNNTQSVTEMDFGNCTTIAQVASIINTAFEQAGITATASSTADDEIVLTSNISGQGSSIELVPYQGAFVDISTVQYLDAATMSAEAGVSPGELYWDTLLYPVSKKNYFEIESSYISVEVIDNE